ncbi:MAG: helix-turn-helix domain-containing protein [Fusobacteriaceae bacterium]
MTNTAKILLKILLHGDLHEDDLEKYFDLDSNSVKKNLKILNDILITEKLGYIQKHNNIYTLQKISNDFSGFLSKLDVLSSQERQDILCIRLLLKNELNLEKLKVEMNISRTTLHNDLNNLKLYLKKNNIEIESKCFKGIFLKNTDAKNIKYILSEKFMALFIGKNFLTKLQKKILEEIDVIDKNKFFKTYSKINDEFKLGKFIFTFYASYSMACVNQLIGPLVFSDCDHSTLNHPELKNISKRLNKLKLDFNSEFKFYLTDIIIKTYYYMTFNSFLNNSFNLFLNKLKDIFELNSNEYNELSNRLIFCYQMGYLNYKYNLFWINLSYKYPHHSEIIDFFSETIKNSNTKMFYSDIALLSNIIIEFLNEKNYSKNFKILFVLVNTNTEQSQKIDNYLQLFYPEVKFEVKNFLDINYFSNGALNDYNLIISEFQNLDYPNLEKIGRLNILELQNILNEIITKKILLKLNHYKEKFSLKKL